MRKEIGMNYDNIDISIRDVQKVELDILIELDRVCKKHGIKYQLFAGTLLGAVRHKGFIPWDDDIDVCLLRKDYDKLLEVCKIELNPLYFLQNYETDKFSNYHFSKIRKNNTIFKMKSSKDTNMHEGIFIDIFPMDNVRPESFLGEVHRKFCNFIFIIISSMIKSRCYDAKNLLVKNVRLLLYYLMKLFPRKFIHSLGDKAFCVFNQEDTDYVACLTNGASREEYNNFMVKKDTFYDLIEWEFEEHKFPIPKEYDYVLTKNYGDYMTPPPLEKQKPHHGIIEVVFDNTKTSKVINN